MSLDYLTIDGTFEYTLVIERSKFICYLKGVDNETEAKEFVSKIKKTNSLATHNCYAYIADEKGLIFKFSDDGEPQSTAGLPILETLKNAKLFKVVAVVTRYFGGTKLGVGGLSRAYSGVVSACIKTSKILDMRDCSKIEVSTTYENYNRLLNLSKKTLCPIIDTDFTDNLKVVFAVEKNRVEQFSDLIVEDFSGKIKFIEKGSGFFPFN